MKMPKPAMPMPKRRIVSLLLIFKHAKQISSTLKRRALTFQRYTLQTVLPLTCPRCLEADEPKEMIMKEVHSGLELGPKLGLRSRGVLWDKHYEALH
jgi:hypothetical protein